MPWTPLPDAPVYPAEGYAPLADRIGRIMGTTNDVLLIQGEAMVALEAAATSLARPGLKVLNVVTSLYGGWFGHWLRRGGAEVQDISGPPGLPVTAGAVADAFARTPGIGLFAMVHAESATGILNPLDAMLAIARDHGALTVVDVVASLGGHPVAVDAAGIDVAVMGPQKALGGQAGVSAVSVSPAAWDRIAPPGPAPSILSLADQRQFWLDTGRRALPGTPSALEFHALEATLNRVEEEGMAAILTRHATAARAARAGLVAMGLPLWVEEEGASNLVTAAPVPRGLDADQLVAAIRIGDGSVAPGVGPAGQRIVRLNHTGPRARLEVVQAALSAYAQGRAALGHGVDLAAGLEAAVRVYAMDQGTCG